MITTQKTLETIKKEGVKMDTINELNKIIETKATDKAIDFVSNMKLKEIDLMNTHVRLPENIGYISDTSETKGQRFVRADSLIPLLKEAIFKKHIEKFKATERDNFLNDLQALRDYLNFNSND